MNAEMMNTSQHIMSPRDQSHPVTFLILYGVLAAVTVIACTKSAIVIWASPLRKIPGPCRDMPHRKLKRFLGPAFTVTSVDQLDSYFMGRVGVLLENYYQALDRSIEAPVISTDFMRDLHCLALDIMGESAFGNGFGQIEGIFNPDSIKTQRDKDWRGIPDAIFEGQAKRYKSFLLIIKAIATLIDERRQMENQKNGPAKQDVLQHMLDEGNRPDTGVRMNNREIIDQMSELLLAGSETTSGTIACLFIELARNVDVKSKLLASLPILGENDTVLDSKTIREDPTYRYLEACIKETLRKHPIASEMGRRTLKQPFYIDDYFIPPFTVVSASYRDLHLNEKYWPEPERFWPERWLNGEERGGSTPARP
ncbi:hypothetical protein NLG97_g339 [Lecanicillium saksenae]|uniref:Uncharacterized protein n=1 Tax=Lecanicillium saksenae TaxID=468837 RepID=A0ACC1R8T2_9HYPO|nr:hypothetical protein NLG97_g339 [Lecanicillium saksenae]